MYYRSNFDYEKALANGDFSRSKPFSKLLYNYEFEYLFFLSKKNGILNTPIKYSSEYLDCIFKLTNMIPEVNNIPQRDYSFWWGSMGNPKKERLLNDKKFFWDFCLDQDIPYPETISNLMELEKIKAKQLILRPRFGMSGIKTQVKEKVGIKELPKDFIASKYYPSRKDFGLLIYESGKTIYYENDISNKFHYKGSTFFPEKVPRSEEKLLKEYISKLKSISQEECNPLQFDGFFTDNNIFFNELNYRETMASVVGEFVRNKYPNRLIKLKVMPYNKYLNIQACENIIKITPDARYFSYRFGLVLEIQD